MSNVYDYAYMHVRRPLAEVSKCPAEQEQEDSSKQQMVVNIHDFTPRDLQLFVDSLETITRLKRAKYERRQQLKIKLYQQSFENSRKIITCLDSSMSCISCDGDAKSSFYNTGAASYLYNVPYEGSSNSSSNNNTYCNISESSSKLYSTQESEESGVFLNNSHPSHFYEHIDIDHIRQRSIAITHPKYKSLKSRLTSLIMKRHYLQPEAPPVTDMLSSTFLGEDLENSDIYERVLDDVIEHQFSKNSKTIKKHHRVLRKKRRFSCPEHKFLDKALSFLSAENKSNQ